MSGQCHGLMYGAVSQEVFTELESFTATLSVGGELGST